MKRRALQRRKQTEAPAPVNTGPLAANTTATEPLSDGSYGWMAISDVAMSATTPLTVMVVDSGCTPAHLVNSTEGLLNYTASVEAPINQAGTGDSLEVIGTGYLEPWGKVKVVPKLRANLLSTSQLWREKQWSTTLGEFCEIKKADGTIVATGKLQCNGLYTIDDVVLRPANVLLTTECEFNSGLRNLPTMSATLKVDGSLAHGTVMLAVLSPIVEAHHRWGHLSIGGLRELARLGLLPRDVTDKALSEGFGACGACLSAKAHRLPTMKIPGVRTTFLGELTHSDICGPMEVETTDGARFFIVFVDDYTRAIRVYLLRHKSEALDAFKLYIQQMLAPKGIQPRTLRSDNGGEYTSAEFDTFCQGINVKRELTNRYSSHQNGVAERAIRTITEMALVQLVHAGLDRSWWGPSVLHAAFTRNRCPTSAIVGRTNIPWMACTGRPIDPNTMIPFGVTAHVHVPAELRTKLDSRAVKGIFLGCPDYHKGYRVWIPTTNKIVTSRNVTFEVDAAGTRDFCKPNATGNTPQVLPAFSAKTIKNMQTELKQLAPAPAVVVDTPQLISPVTAPAGADGNPLFNDLTTEGVNKLTVSQLKIAIKEKGGGEVTNRSRRPALRKLLSQLIESPPGGSMPVTDVQSTTTADTELASAVDDNHLLSNEGVALLVAATDDLRRGAAENYSDECSWVLVITQPQSTFARTVATPRTYAEAIAMPEKEDWEAAMKSELRSLTEKGVYVIVIRTSDMKVLPSRWVFKVKELSDGTIDKFKARFVGKGFCQEYLVHYFETYAPVARAVSIRMMLALAAAWGWKVEQLDANTAFLNADLKEVIYIEPPAGSGCPSGHVWQLKKALYGLKQSPKAWGDMVHAFMIEHQFTPTSGDSCIYVRTDAHTGAVNAIVSAYVDDFKVAAALPEERRSIKELFYARFDMTDIGLLKWYLGMSIVQEPHLITLSQALYVDTILDLFGMSDCAPAPTPMVEVPDPSDGPEIGSDEYNEMKTTPYRQLVGCIMYLAYCTRPDISAAVNKLARCVSNPSTKHWKAGKRVLRYLQGTRTLGLVFDGTHEPILSGYADASWADEDHARRSSCGYLFHLGNSLISWNAYTQRTVSRSSTEAEYMCMSDACQELVWLHRMTLDMGAPQGTVVLREDNQSAIALADSATQHHRRTKHIDIRYHYVCEQLARGLVTIKYCDTTQMVADILTKCLTASQFTHLRALLPLTVVKC